jgi:NADPH:quinone reductase-like Zn-dependent oxidoreductase
MGAYGASSVVSGSRRDLVAALRMLRGMPRFKLIPQMHDSKSVIGLNMLTEWRERGTIEHWARPLRELLDDGTIKPVVADTFDFEHAGDAQEMLVQRRNVGKVVLAA